MQVDGFLSLIMLMIWKLSKDRGEKLVGFWTFSHRVRTDGSCLLHGPKK